MKNLSKSIEDYIEAIYMLEKENGKVRSIDIASKLDVSKPAVNKAMHELKEIGIIDEFNYSNIVLTEKGKKFAKQLYSKHVLICNFLISIGVPEETAQIDCCKIEHVISPETLKCMKKQLK